MSDSKPRKLKPLQLSNEDNVSTASTPETSELSKISRDNDPKCSENANTSSTKSPENATAAAKIALPIYEPKPLRLCVFISGSGRTLKNLIECSGQDFEVVYVVADRLCSGLECAHEAGLPNFTANSPKFHEAMWKAVREENPDYICLAGFLSLLPVPESHKGRVLNIHPALIPKFCGKGMYGSKVHKAVLESGDTESGCTVHFCDNEYDHGKTILQKKLTIDPAWDHEQLAAAVFHLEKNAYPEAIRSLKKRR